MVGAEKGNFENFESLDRWKWHFQSLLFAICDAGLGSENYHLFGSEWMIECYHLYKPDEICR
jgi:hypothetical protein